MGNFGSQQIQSYGVIIGQDPAADDVLPIFRAPKNLEILAARAVAPNAVNGSTANYFAVNLINGGSAGTATTVMSGTIGGTAGWSALTPVSFTSLEGTMTEGDILNLNYNEEGSATIQGMLIQIDYVLGVGA